MTEPNYNWNEPECPKVANYQTTDEKGAIWAYEYRPERRGSIWVMPPKEFGFCQYVKQGPPCPQWRETLRERPKVEAPIPELDHSGEGLEEAFGLNDPWPLTDVISKLVVATEYILDARDCDAHTQEQFRRAADRARELAPKLQEFIRRRITQPKEGGEICHPKATLEIDPAGFNTAPKVPPSGPAESEEKVREWWIAETKGPILLAFRAEWDAMQNLGKVAFCNKVHVHDATACNRNREAMQKELQRMKSSVRDTKEQHRFGGEILQQVIDSQTPPENETYGEYIKRALKEYPDLRSEVERLQRALGNASIEYDRHMKQLAKMSSMLDEEKKEKQQILWRVDQVKTLITFARKAQP